MRLSTERRDTDLASFWGGFSLVIRLSKLWQRRQFHPLFSWFFFNMRSLNLGETDRIRGNQIFKLVFIYFTVEKSTDKDKMSINIYFFSLFWQPIYVLLEFLVWVDIFGTEKHISPFVLVCKLLKLLLYCFSFKTF